MSLSYYKETNQFKIIKPCDALLKEFAHIAIKEAVNVRLFLLRYNRLYRPSKQFGVFTHAQAVTGLFVEGAT